MKTLIHAIFILLAIISYRQIATAESYSINSAGNPQISLTVAKINLD